MISCPILKSGEDDMVDCFVPKETEAGETRAAATPETVTRLSQLGLKFTVQRGLGAAAGFADEAYAKAGAALVDDAAAGYAAAALVLKLHPPTPGEIGLLREGSSLISFLNTAQDPDRLKALNARRISAFGMERIPRITRAQKMDALSSQANIGGYKAVILAADHLSKLFPMLMTAAGTIHPARVVILGAGVAGLQAIATAKRLGAVVEVSDVRPAVKEQVESLGGKYIEVPTDESAEDAGGYAKEQSEEFLKKQRALVRERIVEADVVISTAAIPGKKAPLLIPADMVADMKPGSVIVDLAVETGGNCELSEPGEIVVKHGVKIIGLRNIPGLVPYHATEMYARNIYNLLSDLMKEGELVWDPEDEVVQGALLCKDGEILDPALRPAENQAASQTT
jgi:NAD(P) transhydrogenase subunit alpha